MGGVGVDAEPLLLEMCRRAEPKLLSVVNPPTLRSTLNHVVFLKLVNPCRTPHCQTVQVDVLGSRYEHVNFCRCRTLRRTRCSSSAKAARLTYSGGFVPERGRGSPVISQLGDDGVCVAGRCDELGEEAPHFRTILKLTPWDRGANMSTFVVAGRCDEPGPAAGQERLTQTGRVCTRTRTRPGRISTRNPCD